MICESCNQKLWPGDYFIVRERDHVEAKCCKCKGVASALYYSQQVSTTEATVVHRSATGEVRFPARADAPVPPGFERVELRGVSERDRFERQQNAVENQKHSEFVENRQRFYSQIESQNRSDLRARMGNMSNLGRDFARLAMERSNQKSSPRFDAGFHLSVNHEDSQNRGERSERTGWKRRS